MLNKLKDFKNNKICKIIMAIVRVFLVIFVIGFVLVVFLQRFSNNKLSFFNYRMFTVVSGSMVPKYKIGDVLISKQVALSKIKVGDDVSYLGESGDFKNKVITHEVVSIEKTTDGEYLFRTKGLANIVEDPTVYGSQVYGVVIYKTFILSLIYKIIGTKIGFYIFIILPLLFVIGSEIISTLLDNEEKRRASFR